MRACFPSGALKRDAPSRARGPMRGPSLACASPEEGAWGPMRGPSLLARSVSLSRPLLKNISCPNALSYSGLQSCPTKKFRAPCNFDFQALAMAASLHSNATRHRNTIINTICYVKTTSPTTSRTATGAATRGRKKPLGNRGAEFS